MILGVFETLGVVKNAIKQRSRPAQARVYSLRMNPKSTVKIETRVHLLSVLAEAAELEHDLLCMYLYSIFSLKTSTGQGLSSVELEAVNSWRKTILGVCLEEMTHLALVANLTTAVGGGPHFFRSAFPVRSGFFPSDFVLELAPFDQDTLQHFIFLERPEDEPVEDAEDFKPENEYTQGHPPGRLMAHSGDYTTVGQLYEAIEDGVVSLSNALGEQNLFCGSRSLQISSEDVQLKGLAIVQDKASALEALRMIVQQGEGARTKEIPTLINSAKSPKSMTPFVAGIRISNPAVVPLEIRSCGNRQIRRAKSGSLSLRR